MSALSERPASPGYLPVLVVLFFALAGAIVAFVFSARKQYGPRHPARTVYVMIDPEQALDRAYLRGVVDARNHPHSPTAVVVLDITPKRVEPDTRPGMTPEEKAHAAAEAKQLGLQAAVRESLCQLDEPPVCVGDAQGTYRPTQVILGPGSTTQTMALYAALRLGTHPPYYSCDQPLEASPPPCRGTHGDGAIVPNVSVILGDVTMDPPEHPDAFWNALRFPSPTNREEAALLRARATALATGRPGRIHVLKQYTASDRANQSYVNELAADLGLPVDFSFDTLEDGRRSDRPPNAGPLRDYLATLRPDEVSAFIVLTDEGKHAKTAIEIFGSDDRLRAVPIVAPDSWGTDEIYDLWHGHLDAVCTVSMRFPVEWDGQIEALDSVRQTFGADAFRTYEAGVAGGSTIYSRYYHLRNAPFTLEVLPGAQRPFWGTSGHPLAFDTRGACAAKGQP